MVRRSLIASENVLVEAMVAVVEKALLLKVEVEVGVVW
jgi:hypothetical protein